MNLNCKKIGFINGCFDILHIGHLKMIQHCRKYCDHLSDSKRNTCLKKHCKKELKKFSKSLKIWLDNLNKNIQKNNMDYMKKLFH